MPRRPRNQSAGLPTTTGAAPSNTNTNTNTFNIPAPERAPSRAKIRSLLTSSRSATENMNEIKDSLGGQISDAVENHGLQKKAFGWIKQLDRMSPEKISDVMTHFLYYFDVSGLRERAASAQRLPMGDDPNEQDSASAPVANVNVVMPFPSQASV